MATNFYIDGLNFYYGAVKDTEFKWVDLEAMARLLVPNDDIGRIKYFTAQIKPQFPGDRSQERQHAYLRALKTYSHVDVQLGHFRRDVKWKPLADTDHHHSKLFAPAFLPEADFEVLWNDNVSRRTEYATSSRIVQREEKGSDVNLGVNLVFDCLQGACDKAIVISNDTDLEQAIVLARQSGASVGVINPHRAHRTAASLRKAASFEIPFRPDTPSKCQMPAVVTNDRGKEIHKPKQW